MRKDKIILYIFCVLLSCSGDSIALGTLNNDSTLTMFSERVMITQGEWQLTEISTINYVVNKTGYLENKLIYRVREQG